MRGDYRSSLVVLRRDSVCAKSRCRTSSHRQGRGVRRIPDVLIGALLTVAVLAIGLSIGSQYHPFQPEPATRGNIQEGGQSEYGGLWNWVTHDAAGFFTAWLVIVGGIQVALFIWQLWLIRESLNDTKVAADAAKESAEAAKEGAKVGRESADTAKLAMVASNRAYVHFNGCRWISHRQDEDSAVFWRIRPRWVNSGNTPPRNLHFYVHYELLDAPLAPGYSFTQDDLPKRRALLPPKGEIESESRDFSGTDLAAVKTGTKFLYVWGTAKYRDIFPSTPEHITKFCVFARSITGDPTMPWNATTNIMDIAFATYERHNCADDDCDTA
jgi:hypothetical protein